MSRGQNTWIGKFENNYGIFVAICLLLSMVKARKTYLTFSKVRLALFAQSYTHYFISYYLKRKYKINEGLTLKELRKLYFSKSAIPEISKLAKTLHFNYSPLWKSILINRIPALGKKLTDKERAEVFISIEAELKALFVMKQNKSEFKDPDYESEMAILSIAVERAVGNALKDIDDDFTFEQQSNELQRKYVYWYYKVACKYKLPTIRITPFILRLIA